MKRIFCQILLPVFLFSLAAPARAAAPGALDPTFGVAGKVTRNISIGGNLLDVAVQPDGRVVLAGAWQPGANRDFIVIRLNSNGDFDPTFGTGGIVFTDFFNSYDDASAVAIQTDGKIVVAGSSSVGGFGDVAIARYLPNGDLDTTFDGDGKVVLNSFPGQVGDSLLSLAIQPDGKIVGGGSVETDFLLTRFNLDGSLDTGFGTGGIVITNSVPFTDDVRDVVVLQDGKILAAGGSGRCAVTRYNSNGLLDSSFAAGGIFAANPGYYTQCSGLVVQPDGKLVLAGESAPGTQFNSLLMRLTPNGTPDPTFGTNGFVVANVNPSGADWFFDVSLQSDGKIVAAGFEGEFSTYDFTVVRFSANGSLDTSFADKGMAINDISGNDALHAAVLYGDKLIAVGDSFGENSIKLARYNLAATPTSSADFDGDGLPDYAVFRPSTGTWYVLRSADGSVQIGQFGSPGDIPLDGDFDGDGKADRAIFRPSLAEWWVNKSSNDLVLAIQFGQNSDKPVVGDYDRDGRSDVAFWRPGNGTWYVLRSSDGFTSYFGVPFGQNGDIPIQSSIVP